MLLVADISSPALADDAGARLLVDVGRACTQVVEADGPEAVFDAVLALSAVPDRVVCVGRPFTTGAVLSALAFLPAEPVVIHLGDGGPDAWSAALDLPTGLGRRWAKLGPIAATRTLRPLRVDGGRRPHAWQAGVFAAGAPVAWWARPERSTGVGLLDQVRALVAPAAAAAAEAPEAWATDDTWHGRGALIASIDASAGLGLPLLPTPSEQAVAFVAGTLGGGLRELAARVRTFERGEATALTCDTAGGWSLDGWQPPASAATGVRVTRAAPARFAV